jgi:O-antigen ligase
MKQATNTEFVIVGAAIAGISLPTIFFLQALAGYDVKYLVYLPWCLVLTIASLWSALIPIGVLIMLSSNATFLGLVTATAYIAFGATCLHYRAYISRHIFSWPTLVFLFLIVISCCWAMDPLLWISEYPTFQAQELPLWLLAFSVAIIVASDTGRLPLLLWIVVGCATLGAVAILLNLGGGAPAAKDLFRHQGLTSSDMFSGWPMLAGVILVFESINSERSLIWRVASVCLAFISMTATAYTGTRSALVGLVAGCLSLVFLSIKIRRSIMAALALILIVTVIVIYIPSVSTNIIGRFTDKSMQTGSTRLEIWGHALNYVYPLSPYFGIGWNNFSIAMEQTGYKYANAHNVCVQVLVEFGTVGFAIFAWWCLSLFWFTRIGPYGQLLRALLVAVLVQGLFLHPLYCAYFWIVIGLIEGERQCQAQKKYRNVQEYRVASLPAVKSWRYVPKHF